LHYFCVRLVNLRPMSWNSLTLCLWIRRTCLLRDQRRKVHHTATTANNTRPGVRNQSPGMTIKTNQTTKVRIAAINCCSSDISFPPFPHPYDQCNPHLAVTVFALVESLSQQNLFTYRNKANAIGFPNQIGHSRLTSTLARCG
jgi:hypothetical protein